MATRGLEADENDEDEENGHLPPATDGLARDPFVSRQNEKVRDLVEGIWHDGLVTLVVSGALSVSKRPTTRPAFF